MATTTTIKERISQLDAGSFQILCDAYLSRIGYPNLVALGTMNGSQKTTLGTPDTYFCMRGGQYIFAEYTTQKEQLSKKICSDIDKCLNVNYTHIELCQITEIIYCHTSSNITPKDDCKFKKRCADVDIKLTLIGIDKLAEDLMKYPSIIKDHLGLSIDTEQIQTIEDFIKQYNSNTLAATLNTPFLFREKEFSNIMSAFDQADIVLLSGPAGTGKTRLALEYARKYAEATKDILYCIHDRSLPLYDDLKLYFEKPGRYFVLVDDANQLSEIKHVVEYVNILTEGYHIKIIITVRDYAVKKVKNEISNIASFEIVNLGIFSVDEIKSLVKEYYSIFNPHYLDRIAQIAQGNARIAMLAGKIACKTHCLDSINDVSQLYSNYYGSALHEAGLDSDKRLLLTAGIMAFLNTIHLDHIDSLSPILLNSGISKEIFLDNLYILHELEIVDIYHDKAVRFSEQCFSNFILKYVFYDKKHLDLSLMIETCFNTYRERTIDAINILVNVFQIKELHEYVEHQIRFLWKKLDDKKSPDFLEYVKAFYPINQTETLKILKAYIDNTEIVKIRAEEIDIKDGKNYKSVKDEIISILGGYADTENLEAALDLFFQYYLKRPDMYIQFYHASIKFYCIQRNSSNHNFYTSIIYLKKMIEYSNNWKNNYISLLFFDVIKEFLQLVFSSMENTGRKYEVVFYHIPLILSDKVCEYRLLIWTQLLFQLNSQKRYDEILTILQNYGLEIEDCSKDIIKFDAPYICNLLNFFPNDNLACCLTAVHLKQVFERADCSTHQLNNFLDNNKMRLYQILQGPKLTPTVSREEREDRKKQHVLEYLRSSDNLVNAFRAMFSIYVESSSIKNKNCHDIADGINIALQELAAHKEIYFLALRCVLESETVNNIDIYTSVHNLFSVSTPAQVFEYLSYSNITNKNSWMYAYYHELPQNCVNEYELKELYDFLRDDSDRLITHSSSRDIDFLDKFLNIDSNVVLKGSRIILEKQAYSPFIVSLYFSQLFNKYAMQPTTVINKFSGDLGLLEDIYIYLELTGRNDDYTGEFLYEICMADKKFIAAFSNALAAKKRWRCTAEGAEKYLVFYQNESYIQIIDTILTEAFNNSKMPESDMESIIKLFITPFENDSNNNEKRDAWIKHFIKSNCHNKLEMECLFTVLSELSVQKMVKYIDFFISCNNDFEAFKILPLIPRSFSWSGSVVPLYVSWKEYLESLLVLFPGIKFIEHKNYVEKLIDDFRKKIEDEEIKEILTG